MRYPRILAYSTPRTLSLSHTLSFSSIILEKQQLNQVLLIQIAFDFATSSICNVTVCLYDMSFFSTLLLPLFIVRRVHLVHTNFCGLLVSLSLHPQTIVVSKTSLKDTPVQYTNDINDNFLTLFSIGISKYIQFTNTQSIALRDVFSSWQQF